METARGCVSAALVLLFLLAHAAVVSAYYPTQRPSGGVGGRRCSPPFGFRARGCGVHEILNREAEGICEYLWGPNVCLITDTIRSNVYEYRSSQSCDWVYSHYYYSWVRQCNSVCQPTDVCLEETQVYNRSYEMCCPGFAGRRRSSAHNPYNQYRYDYYIPIRSEPEGCPIAVADSLLECLQLQGLDEFLEYVDRSVYARIFNETTDTHITLFVPTNDAVRRAIDSNFIPEPTNPIFNMSQFVENHLVYANVTMASLRLHIDKIYVNANDRNLHKVAIAISDGSSVTYAQNPYSDPSSGSSLSVRSPFINGAEVVLEDACNTVNATLHIISKPLAPTASTIANYLRTNDASFSMFTDALSRAGILQFLDNPNVSRTVFAISNDAFAAAFPEDLLDCMLNYMRRPINDILLLHIGPGAHYDTSLSKMNFFFTLLQQYVEVEVDSATGDILLGRCGVPIVQSNVIMASNGVIHTIDGVLFPNAFSFGMCQDDVPFPSPIECPVEPSPSPTVSATPSLTNSDLFPGPTPSG